jgi:hypothetical protein
MRKMVFVAIIFWVILPSCSKHIEDFKYDNSNSLLTVAKWKISGNDRIAHYEFKEKNGVSKLTTSWVDTNMQVGSKTVNAKMGEIEQGDGFLSFKINGTKYIYRYE